MLMSKVEKKMQTYLPNQITWYALNVGSNLGPKTDAANINHQTASIEASPPAEGEGVADSSSVVDPIAHMHYC